MTSHAHTRTSALVRLIAGGAATAEEQEAAEHELDLRVPMPEVKTAAAIRCTVLRRDDALEYHATILSRYGCELEEAHDLESDQIIVRCDPASLSGVRSYINACPVLRYASHELIEERA